MKLTIFYSWESDLPNSTNRGFIEGELKAIAKEITGEGAVVVEVDRDTSGVAGSPDIGKTILAKIDAADAFVGDVSIINPDAPAERKTPNPNVMFELGWAFKSLGENRVITVMNTAFGGLDGLPFDLKQRRTVKYALPKDTDKASAKKVLRDQLREAIETVIDERRRNAHTSTPIRPNHAERAVKAIENSLPSQEVEARDLVEVLAKDLDKIAPHVMPGDPEENLLKAIDASRPLVEDFGRAARAAANMRSAVAVRGLVEGLEHLLDRYWPINLAGPGFVVSTNSDFYKFIGHELGAVLGGHLLHARCWQLFADLFVAELPINDPTRAPGRAGIGVLSRPVELLNQRSKKTGQISVQAELLKARHDGESPAGGVGLDDFLGADLLLLMGTFRPGQPIQWWPRSAPILANRTPPRALRMSTTPAGARDLTTAICQREPDEMRVHVASTLSLLASGHRDLPELGFFFDPTTIVTR